MLQAAVASLHCADPVDWPQVAVLYAELAALTGSAVVQLNRAVAVAESGHAAAALRIVDELALDGYPYLHSTRAQLLVRLDRRAEARVAYERALELTRSPRERQLLRRRLAEL